MKKSYLYAVITLFIWATMASVTKMILTDIPNMQALSVSSFFSTGFLLIANLKSGKLKKMRALSLKDYGIIAGLSFIGLFLYSALYFYGLTQLSSQEACIVNYLWPIMLVVFSCIILKERLTPMKAIAMLCSFAGIVILSTGNIGEANGNAALGVVSCIIAAACYGLYSVLNKKADYDQSIFMMIGWLIVAVCSTIVGPMTETWVPIHGTQWLGIVWLGVFSHAIAYLLWALALKYADDTAKIANMAFMTPFLSLIISSVLLKEQLQPRAFIALIFIVGGIIVQNFYELLKKKK